MCTKRFLQAVIVLAVFAAPGLAVADINADGRLGRFGITLEDLDANDGITPGLTFAGLDYEYNRASGWVQVFQQGSSGQGFAAHTPYDAEGNPLTAAVNGGSAYDYRTSIDGRADLAALTLATELALTQDQNLMHSGISEIRSDAHRFFITPNTKVTFHGTLGLDAAITGVENVEQEFSIHTWSTIWSPAVPEHGEVYSVRETERELIGKDGSDHILVEDVPVFIEMWNYSDQERFGQVLFRVQTEAWARPVLQVPEPATYAMLGAGLALIGASTRRRRH
jgi:hypothetical protein